MTMFIKTCQALNIVSLSISIPANILLQYTVKNASPKSFGNYTKLMYTHSVNLMIFAVLHTFLTPIISIQKNVIFVFSPVNPFNLSKSVVSVLMACYGSSYCFSLVICAITFVFRWDRVCEGPLRLYRNTRSLIVWITAGLLISLCWALVIYCCAKPTPYVDGIMAGPLQVTYGTSLENVTYVAAAYQIWAAGVMEWNTMGIFLGIFCSSVILGTIATILACFRAVMKAAEGLNETEVQAELIRAQCIQAFIPISMIFLPVIALLILPIFCIDGNIVFSFVNVLLAIFTIIDPIALICSVTQYRTFIFTRSSDPYAESQ